MRSVFKDFIGFDVFDSFFSGFMQADLKETIKPLTYETSSFKSTENNTYLAEFTYPSFVTADMIDIDVIDEKRMMTISYKFKDSNGCETSGASMERLPDDADINSLTATFDNGKLMLTMNKLAKETTPKTIDVRHI